MKTFQQKLLLVLAFCLCGLCAWQWYVQSVQRTKIQDLGQLVSKKIAALQEATNTIATMDHQISQMDDNLTALKHTVETNDALIASQKLDLQRLRAAGDEMKQEIAEYKKAVDDLDAKLKTAYDGIQKQNDAIKKLIGQRDDLVTRLNNSIKDRNDIVVKYNDAVKNRNDVVTKYNDLVKQIEKQQAAAKAGSGASGTSGR